MAQYRRSNAWNNAGTFDNPDLLWYAKGVGAMMARQLSDPLSWWFFAAIHGEYVRLSGFPGWGNLPAPPQVPTSPVPTSGVRAQFWNQCQHGSWYFLPWHRGYLWALEAQVRAEIVQLGGPSTWALPYWNYFGPDNQFNIPPAFTQQQLPDSSPNPLFVSARYGPDSNGNIYVPLGLDGVNAQSMLESVFSYTDIQMGFGGGVTGFSHSGGETGGMERNPHNPVHGFVGGFEPPPGPNYGLMADPGLAALDPIFYLHHANIDRLWAVWNETLGYANPTDRAWLLGPVFFGLRGFVMPMSEDSLVYTPQDVTSLSQLNYTYDDLSAPSQPAAPQVSRLVRLGAVPAPDEEGVVMAPGTTLELVGASAATLPVVGTVARAAVQLDVGMRRKVSASLAAASASAPPDRLYLHLEDVRGTQDAYVLNVYINLPEGERPGDHPELLAGIIGLFGLRRASMPGGPHAGSGLSFTLDITDIVDALHLNNALDVDTLQVSIVPNKAVPDYTQITIDRISIYRKGN